MIDLTKILTYLARFAILLLILPAHEFAHAFAAYKNGDYTAKYSGRYTLNPLKHFDIVGLLCFMLVGFGWAKPVPVNPYNFRDFKKGCFWVSIAGVLTNLVLAFLFYPLYLLASELPYNHLNYFIYCFLYFGYSLNIAFCVFNLIPVYPLDGFRLVDTFAKKRGKLFQFLRTYGYYTLIGLIFLSSYASRSNLSFLNIFGYFMEFATEIVGYPITAFCNFILG